MEFIVVVTASIVTIVLSYLTFLWIGHISLTKAHVYKYGWGNYRKFKREFDKHNWKVGSSYLRGVDIPGTSIYVSSYVFQHKGMLINNPISFYFTERLVIKYMKKHLEVKEFEKVKW